MFQSFFFFVSSLFFLFLYDLVNNCFIGDFELQLLALPFWRVATNHHLLMKAIRSIY